MSVTVELSEQDAFLWDAFRRGGEWVAASEYRKLMAQNAKLRELCATVVDDWMSKVCPSFPFCEYGGEYQDCTDETCGNQIYRQMARELGVEADG